MARLVLILSVTLVSSSSIFKLVTRSSLSPAGIKVGVGVLVGVLVANRQILIVGVGVVETNLTILGVGVGVRVGVLVGVLVRIPLMIIIVGEGLVETNLTNLWVGVGVGVVQRTDNTGRRSDAPSRLDNVHMGGTSRSLRYIP